MKPLCVTLDCYNLTAVVHEAVSSEANHSTGMSFYTKDKCGTQREVDRVDRQMGEEEIWGA